MHRTPVTIAFIVIAALFVAYTLAMQPVPPNEAVFDDQGETFFPEFTDPLAAASLEVIAYDESSGLAEPFNVALRDGRWSIPSHYDYPADGADRLASTAAGLINLKKDVVQSDRREDHEALGVIDPTDDTIPSFQGRGALVTVRDEAGSALATYILGKSVPGKDGFRYVRVPGQKRTYAVRMDVDISTRFADWIDTNVLSLTSADITKVSIDDYTVDESTGAVDFKGQVRIDRTGSGFADWILQMTPPGRELDPSKVSTMLRALTGITITGVRPKPESLSADLTTSQGLRMDTITQLSLQSRGFFVSQDGRLLSNEGDVSVGAANGVQYTLRFGEVLYGEGIDISAGSELNDEETASADDRNEGETENRYLFVTAQFNEALLDPKPAPPASPRPGADEETEGPPDEAAVAAREALLAEWGAYDAALADWEARAAEGRAEVDRLNARFAPWYYVISGKDFADIRLDLERITKPIAPGGGQGPTP